MIKVVVCQGAVGLRRGSGAMMINWVAWYTSGEGRRGKRCRKGVLNGREKYVSGGLR